MESGSSGSIVHGPRQKPASELAEGDIVLGDDIAPDEAGDPAVVLRARSARGGGIDVDLIDGRHVWLGRDTILTCGLYLERTASRIRVGDMLDLQGDAVVDPDDDRPEFASQLALVQEIEPLDDGTVTIHFDTCSADFPMDHPLRWNRRDASFDEVDMDPTPDRANPVPASTRAI